MSILLEALRKSESSQRSREAPTIHSEVPSAPEGRFSNRFTVGVLLVLTLLISGWFTWNQYHVPAGIDSDALAGEQRSNESLSTGAPEQRTALAANERSVQQESAGSGNPVAASAKPTQVQQATGDKGERASQSLGRRTPMESYQAEVEASKPGETAGPTTVAEKDDRGFSARTNQLREAFNRRNSGNVSETEEKPFEPQEPELLGYWDLPDNVRANVAEFKFTVLVYDKRPENRFVLVNGERYVEGDEQQSGLVVDEIRRDGVVYKYRLYRFLVEK